MKKMVMFGCVVLMAAMALTLTSCGDDDEENSELVIEIDAVPVTYTVPSSRLEVPGMYVRVVGKEKWKKWMQKEIKGFTYEEGYYYRLVIGSYSNEYTPYKLIRVLEKTPCSTSVIKEGEKQTYI